MSSVPVSELETNLRDVLRRVKDGEIVTLTESETPVAQIVPMRKSLVLRANAARAVGFNVIGV